MFINKYNYCLEWNLFPHTLFETLTLLSGTKITTCMGSGEMERRYKIKPTFPTWMYESKGTTGGKANGRGSQLRPCAPEVWQCRMGYKGCTWQMGSLKPVSPLMPALDALLTNGVSRLTRRPV